MPNTLPHSPLIEKIKRIGLNDKAARVYVTLLELGGAFPAQIAAATNLNRSTVYAILLDLSVKGLVGHIERNKKLFYYIEKPKQLVRFAEGQARIAEERREIAEKTLGDVEGLYSLLPHKPRVRFLDGVDGLKSIYEDHVSEDTGYEMVGYTNAATLQAFFPKNFLKTYVTKKARLGITSRGIAPDTAPDRSYAALLYKNTPKKFWPVFKYIPAKVFPYKNEITIYGKNKISIINFENATLIGVIIEDKTIHDMMRLAFELAWQGAGKK